MTEPSLFHNRRARGDCSHRISSYTFKNTQLGESNSKWVHVCVHFEIRYLNKISNSLILLERAFILTFPMSYLAFLFFVDLLLVLRARAVTNHFPYPSIFTFDSEYVVSILSRSSNFSEIFKISYIFKVKHLSLPLISLCFLTLRWPQFIIFTDSKNLTSYLWTFPPRTFSEWSDHDK